MVARLPGQREDDSYYPDHIAEAFHRRRCPQRAQHRAAAPRQFDEFKQIIGRGTRLYDGKDYFTIYDFVKAHHHFSDAEWDGEPVEPETCKKCGCYPCVCEKKPMPPCEVCGNSRGVR